MGNYIRLIIILISLSRCSVLCCHSEHAETQRFRVHIVDCMVARRALHDTMRFLLQWITLLAAAVTRSHCGHSRVSSVFCALFVSNAVRLRGLCLSVDMHRGLHGCASHLGRYVACLPRQIQSVSRSYGCLMLLGVQCMKQRTCTYIRNNACDMVLLDAQICPSEWRYRYFCWPSVPFLTNCTKSEISSALAMASVPE